MGNFKVFERTGTDAQGWASVTEVQGGELGLLGHHRAKANQGLPEGEARRVGERHTAEANFHCVTDRQEDENVDAQIWPQYQNQGPTPHPQYVDSHDSGSLRVGNPVQSPDSAARVP